MEAFLGYCITGILTGILYGLIALGFVIIYKASGVFNFAHGQLVALGAFLFWQFIVEFGLPVTIAIPCLFFSLVIIAFLLERAFLDRLIGQPAFPLVMVTLAMFTILQGVIVLFWGGPALAYPQIIPLGTINWGNIVIGEQYIWTSLASIIILAFYFYFFERTRMGLAMKAVSESHWLSHLIGISVRNIFVLAWIMACLVAAAGGILLGFITGLHAGLSGIGLKAIPVVLLGGLESMHGVIVAGIIIGLIEALVGSYLDPLVGGGLRDIVPFAIMILVLFFKPEGLFGWKRMERV